jgi:hypothetical protein
LSPIILEIRTLIGLGIKILIFMKMFWMGLDIVSNNSGMLTWLWAALRGWQLTSNDFRIHVVCPNGRHSWQRQNCLSLLAAIFSICFFTTLSTSVCNVRGICVVCGIKAKCWWVHGSSHEFHVHGVL